MLDNTGSSVYFCPLRMRINPHLLQQYKVYKNPVSSHKKRAKKEPQLKKKRRQKEHEQQLCVGGSE